ncbi:MucR family transcriptional regulator [Microvirga tunisiensis]|uniref:MucR family transcriptional regulator n=1 Tax=Microvirga tunisiensis TaxID=2108360 RepID=A0A5N7MIR6_9HYPH|nr:MucR family transcriptional regulator [Microvirga tunisiensis]MPR05636.1 hypothetical protein [Microvirga tunisiensis]MPR23836.1 hypothetical protein [Microvirga tunisiensis]
MGMFGTQPNTDAAAGTEAVKSQLASVIGETASRNLTPLESCLMLGIAVVGRAIVSGTLPRTQDELMQILQQGVPSVGPTAQPARVERDVAPIDEADVEAIPTAASVKESIDEIIARTVFDDYIVSLIDGRRFQTLTRHLRSAHNMTPEDYRKRFGLPESYPMTAKNFREKRREKSLQIAQESTMEDVPFYLIGDPNYSTIDEKFPDPSVDQIGRPVGRPPTRERDTEGPLLSQEAVDSILSGVSKNDPDFQILWDYRERMWPSNENAKAGARASARRQG